MTSVFNVQKYKHYDAAKQCTLETVFSIKINTQSINCFISLLKRSAISELL